MEVRNYREANGVYTVSAGTPKGIGVPAAIRLVCLLVVLFFAVSASAQTQPCSFSISPTSATFGAPGGDGLISLTASSGSCPREVSSNVNWITVTFGQSGTGNGTSSYRVQANNTPNQRTGTLNVAGQVFTVTQAAGTCSVQLNPTRATVLATGGSGQFDVTTGCSWTATTSASWITLSQSTPTGNGSVTWTASANTTSSQRTGAISIGSQSFTLTQEASCVFTLTANTSSFTANGGTGAVTVQGPTACDRTATSDVSWIRITSGASGEGNGTINFTVDANTTRQSRIGNIRVNNAYLVTITQQANTCVLTVNPTRVPGNINGGSGVFAVSSTCAWTAVSKTEWVRVLTASGTGSGTVSYEYGTNFGALARGGFIEVNDVTFVIDQPGRGCDIEINPEQVEIPAAGATGTVAVSAQSDCSWTPTPTAEWITIESKTNEGFRYRVAANPAVTTRTATITLGSKIVTIRQAAAGCSVSIGAATSLELGADGGTGTIPVTANCAWRAIPNAEWIRITSPATGSSDAQVTFSVSPNSDQDQRTGAITIGEHRFTVTQAGQRCTVTLASTTAALPARGGTGAIAITGGPSCEWSAISGAPWLRITWSRADGTGSVRFEADPNGTGAERVASISVSGQTITVRQPALTPRITQQGIVNAASFTSGPVAPGEIVTIFGTGFGPAVLAPLQLTANGQAVTTAAGETRVLFDGQPAPMVYSTDGQLSAIVPYAVAGNPTTSIEVEYYGARSNAVQLPVAASAPGIFTAASSGTGQAAILNQDFSVNGRDNAAPRGSVIQMYATGEGQTVPVGTDGKLAAPPLPVATLPVTVRIGGIDAPVLYSGGAPGLVAGVIQINARVPQEVPPGPDTPIVIRFGQAESRAGTTVAIR